MKNKKVWFVTGASKGLGLALAKKLIAEGYSVAATSRSKEALEAAVGKNLRFLPLEMDLSDEVSVSQALRQAVEKFGRVDVVVNNAGYGQGGAVEEVSDKEARENFEVNVFGLLNVVRKASALFREQRSGHFLNISSIGGFTGGFSGWGVYCATKFAVTGLTEAIGADLKAFNAHATVVYPGYFRTNFLEGSSMKLPGKTIAEYTDAQASMAKHTAEINQNQPGDPDKAAAAMISVAEESHPPMHLFLGTDAYAVAQEKIKQLNHDIERMKWLSQSTDF